MQKHKIARFSFCVLNVDHDVECTDIHPAVFKNVEEVSMSEQSMKTNPSSSQNAPQQVDPSLETLLQVLSNVDSEIVLHEAATAKEATIDALLTRFEDITSILRQAKRQRQLKRKDYGTSVTLTEQQSLDCDSKTLGNRARMPTEILRQLTQSGFLSTVDLAKTLLLTCKCYGIDLGREYVYEYLCKSRWRNIAKLPPSLIADRGHYWLFRNLSRGLYILEELPSTLPPPAFSYDDMFFSVSIRDGSGKEIVSEVFCGEQLATLEEDGSAGIFLEQPIRIGSYPYLGPATVAYNDYKERYEEHEHWSVTVHFFRLDQNKCCCVHESGDFHWITGIDYPWADPRPLADSSGFLGCVNSNPSASALELDEGGKRLEGRIQALDQRSPEDPYAFQGYQFGVNLVCTVQEQEQHQDDPSARTVVIEFEEVRLAALQVDLDQDHNEWFTNASEHHHGVTLPHLLEHLKGWEDATRSVRLDAQSK
jgi:hypothetical protein